MASKTRPGVAFAVAGGITLTVAALLMMQQDIRAKEGPASIYKPNETHGPNDSDPKLNTTDINQVVEGKSRGDQAPLAVDKTR
ncbi:uncharacterized protein EV420DRAFT_1540537 [Desarmillaria tabescens]|uniref:Uncharacterized protein n=1 Tax=Armillaria tabescens TaxID=1929756 RepID=A0AA39KCV2_ARMTA|nr:uncharacterized protein EV420DRAFT_1540537 [Desarmillaria tabescens]KAK0458785.1 hypothetical protein EV420DRAFT_1540537 [Desarmillaria tabescens]